MIQFRVILVERGYKAADIFNENVGLPAISLAHTNLTKFGAKAIEMYMKRAIMGRVPVFTGNLRDRILITRYYMPDHVEIRIWGNTAYARFQESGYFPHYIPIEYIYKHISNPLAPTTFEPVVSKWVLVRKYTPYVSPAYISLRKRYVNIFKRQWYKEMVARGTINKRTEY